MKIGQKFYMSCKIKPVPRLFVYEGSNPETPTSEHQVREVETGELSEVETEWFNQRIIKLA